MTTDAGHRATGIRAALRKFKDLGIIDEDILQHNTDARNALDKILQKAKQWHETGFKNER